VPSSFMLPTSLTEALVATLVTLVSSVQRKCSSLLSSEAFSSLPCRQRYREQVYHKVACSPHAPTKIAAWLPAFSLLAHVHQLLENRGIAGGALPRSPSSARERSIG